MGKPPKPRKRKRAARAKPEKHVEDTVVREHTGEGTSPAASREPNKSNPPAGGESRESIVGTRIPDPAPHTPPPGVGA